MNHPFGSRKRPDHNQINSTEPQDELRSFLPVFEEYLGRSGLAPATIRNYLADVRSFLRWHQNDRSRGTLPQPSQFAAYRDHLIEETDHAPATVNRHLQALRVFGRWLQEKGTTRGNPARDLRLIPNGHTEETLPRVLEYDEIEALVVAVRSGGRPSLMHRDYAIVELMLQAGLRVNEVAGLDVQDIVSTRDGLHLAVRGATSDHYREVPVNELLARALREYLEARPAWPAVERLFVSQRGQPLSTRSIQRLVESYAEAARLDGVCATSLRHTCAKKMLDETKAPRLVAQWLGHKHLQALKRYE